MRRFAVCLAAAASLLMTAQPTHTSAQGAPANPFASLGLPEITITLTDDGFQLPETIAAGTLLVTLDNQTAPDPEVDNTSAAFFKEPETVTKEQMLADLQGDAFPAWFFETAFNSSVFALPGGQGHMVATFEPGTWYVIDANFERAPTPMVVTGALEVAPALEADLSVDMLSYGFDIPEAVAAGSQVWKVTNSSPVPHHMILFSADQRYTKEELLAAVMADESGTPVAGAPSEESLQDTGYVGFLSAGRTVWVTVDFAPGEYVAMCFVTDNPDSEAYHAMMGMIDPFTVA